MFDLCLDVCINFRVLLKSSMKKAHVYKWSRYDFGGLITMLYRYASVPKELLDYKLQIQVIPFSVSRKIGSDIQYGPTFTSQEHTTEMSGYMNGCIGKRFLGTR